MRIEGFELEEDEDLEEEEDLDEDWGWLEYDCIVDVCTVVIKY